MTSIRNYRYVFFDAGASKKGRIDQDNYYYICTEELRKYDDIIIVSYPLDYLHPIFYIIFRVCRKLARIFRLECLNSIWYPYYFIDNYVGKKPLCFIVYGYYITPNYLKYLKDKYPGCKIVKIHRDSYKIWREKNILFTDKELSLFDFQFSFDKMDSIKYNMVHFEEIESKTNVCLSEDYPLYDVFFAGAAKDRLNMILAVHSHLTSHGIKCFFYITNVPSHDRVYREGIFYSNSPMSYRDMLFYSINSKVILEINQNNVDGYTSRFLEAVIYNKKLITNNIAIVDNKYYNENNILLFRKIEDIKISFINSDTIVNYDYTDDFAPIHLIELIDRHIS